jgi:hypothetical protein
LIVLGSAGGAIAASGSTKTGTVLTGSGRAVYGSLACGRGTSNTSGPLLACGVYANGKQVRGSYTLVLTEGRLFVFSAASDTPAYTKPQRAGNGQRFTAGGSSGTVTLKAHDSFFVGGTHIACAAGGSGSASYIGCFLGRKPAAGFYGEMQPHAVIVAAFPSQKTVFQKKF